MVCLATVAAAHLCGRVRCCSARASNVAGVAEPVRLLAAQGADTLRDWAAQWWLTLAPRFPPVGKSKGVGPAVPEFVPMPAFRPLPLPARGGDYRRFIANLL